MTWSKGKAGGTASSQSLGQAGQGVPLPATSAVGRKGSTVATGTMAKQYPLGDICAPCWWEHVLGPALFCCPLGTCHPLQHTATHLSMGVPTLRDLQLPTVSL